MALLYAEFAKKIDTIDARQVATQTMVFEIRTMMLALAKEWKLVPTNAD